MAPSTLLPEGITGLVNVYKKRWENHGKTMGKPWENGDLYGKIMNDPPCY